jgi:hypothetical protein
VNIAQLVDRGIEIRRELKKLAAELKEIEATLKEQGLKASAAGRVEDLKDADREGRRWLAKGSTAIVPVVFTADMIVGSFTKDSRLHQAIEAVAVGNLREFFKPVNKFENRFDDGKKFRAHAVDILDKAAPAFITACLARAKHGLPKSDIKIEWDQPEVKF